MQIKWDFCKTCHTLYPNTATLTLILFVFTGQQIISFKYPYHYWLGSKLPIGFWLKLKLMNSNTQNDIGLDHVVMGKFVDFNQSINKFKEWIILKLDICWQVTMKKGCQIYSEHPGRDWMFGPERCFLNFYLFLFPLSSIACDGPDQMGDIVNWLHAAHAGPYPWTYQQSTTELNPQTL